MGAQGKAQEEIVLGAQKIFAEPRDNLGVVR